MLRPSRLTATFVSIVTTLGAGPAGAGEIEDAILILEALHAGQLTAEYEDERLTQVAEDLSGRLPAPVRIDWESLIRLGIDSRQRVTLELAPTAGARVLAGLCLVLGDEFERPVYEVYGGQIVITTVEGTASMRVLDVYDVRDLLVDSDLARRLRESAPLPDAPSEEPAPPAPSLPTEDPAADPPVTLPDADPDGVPVTLPTGATPSRGPASDLLGLVMDHVDPEAWFESGGTLAKMSEREGLVLVSATPTTHWRLRDALRRLRAANPASITFEAAIVELPESSYTRLARRHATASAGLAGALKREAGAAILWSATLVASPGQPLAVETRRDDVEIRLGLDLTMDETRGLRHLAVELSTVHGPDERSVRTTASLAGRDAAALIQLPSASPSHLGRYLVIIPRR
ncbi:MAG: hypothetical protein ACYTGG_06100 [Planctomycetota bacterium]